MCGIAGFLNNNQKDVGNILNSMIVQLEYRGPDDKRIWVDCCENIGLAHARLSIVDLTDLGCQPMHSHSKRYTLVFNGEIYNHLSLRSEIETLTDVKWRGHSDTEVLLESISFWGIEKALGRANGMFALALWDNLEQKLLLARDRIGEKPLYYGWIDNCLVFASELKALKKFPNFKSEIDRGSLALYLRYNSIPAPYSIYKDIKKVEPGSILSIKHGDIKTEKITYWSTINILRNGKKNQFSGGVSESSSKLESVLTEAIKLQMKADVPLGAFLSGGVDSSLIAALMQANSSENIKTFSIGFDNKNYNEAEYARAVSTHLGTEHYDMYVTSQDAINVIPLLPTIYDEPFSDSSQIPTYLVSKIAKQRVTVSLSGDAGDELFGGYNRYTMTEQYWKVLSRIPLGVRRKIKGGIQSVSVSTWNKYLSVIFKSKYTNIGDKLHKGANILPSIDIDDLYLRITSQIEKPEEWLVNSIEHQLILTNDESSLAELSSIERMMAFDILNYLPTDILTKVDRAAMAVSLETRIPFLDYNVIEFAASLPESHKVSNGVGKKILREVLYKYVPREMIERPKMGFGVPLDEWLRGPLREWAECLLDSDRLKKEGYFNVLIVRKRWEEHISGRRNWQYQLWSVLMFQAWLENEAK